MEPVAFYKCMADDTRLKALLLISRHGEICVCELTQMLALSQPKVSRHLAALRQCGLLTDERRGKWVYYRFSPALPEWIREVLALTLKENEAYINQCKPYIEASCC